MKKIFEALLVFVTFLLISCSDSIKTECDIDIPDSLAMKASLAEIQDKVFTPSCATSYCHDGSGQNPNLSSGNSFNSLVNKSNTAGNASYVVPNNSQSSWIITRLKGGNNTPVMPPSGALQNKVIDSIAAWIDSGANNN